MVETPQHRANEAKQGFVVRIFAAERLNTGFSIREFKASDEFDSVFLVLVNGYLMRLTEKAIKDAGLTDYLAGPTRCSDPKIRVTTFNVAAKGRGQEMRSYQFG